MALIAFPNVSLESVALALDWAGQRTHTSIYTGSQQTISRGVGRWAGTLTFPLMSRSQQAANIGRVEAFFARAEGAVNEFDLPLTSMARDLTQISHFRGTAVRADTIEIRRGYDVGGAYVPGSGVNVRTPYAVITSMARAGGSMVVGMDIFQRGPSFASSIIPAVGDLLSIEQGEDRWLCRVTVAGSGAFLPDTYQFVSGRNTRGGISTSPIQVYRISGCVVTPARALSIPSYSFAIEREFGLTSGDRPTITGGLVADFGAPSVRARLTSSESPKPPYNIDWAGPWAASWSAVR